MLIDVDAAALVIDALAQLGIEAHEPTDTSDRGVDLVLDANGVGLALQVKRRALVTDSVAKQLLRTPPPGAAALLVVADRVTETARTLLTTRHAGFYDLRGRLALRNDGVIIDAAVEPLRQRSPRMSALTSKAGLEVATALLMQPERGTAVRELARQLGRSASTVSDVLAALRRDGLVDARNAVTDSRLFWQVADHWATPRTYLASLPPPGQSALTQALRLGLADVDHEPGWALTDSAAAAAYGAPLTFRSGQTLDFYVPDQAIQRRAVTLLGAASTPAQAQAAVRIAPVPAVVQSRVNLDTNPLEWPLAHPLFVALDLAQDIGRGREILDAWTPGQRWTRAW